MLSRKTWMRRVARVVRVLAVVAALWEMPAMAQDAPVALTARVTEDAGVGRVEIGLSERLAFRVFSLTEPERIIVDFPRLDWRLEAPRPGVDATLVDGLRFGVRRGGARMAIDLRGPARVAEAYTETAAGVAPARFVMRLEPMAAADFARNAGWPRDAKPESDADLGQRRDVMVVIDPGHGGRDIGAVSGDLAEAALMLDYAQRLAKAIRARPGYDAALTREKDEFLTLRQRVDIARRLGADVFLSLHADSLEEGHATGASVFTLSDEATSREAAALADSANSADQLSGVAVEAEEGDVVRVLIAFAQRRTTEQSLTLAETIVDRLDGRVPILRDRAIQSAGFRVLKAPDVPSVLLELGFLSSPRDRERLLSEQGRTALIEGIADGVFTWVETQEGERYAPARRAAGR